MQYLNQCMRNPAAYIIKYVAYRYAGSDWCIYPTYDFIHCLNDSLENIACTLCTLELQKRRDSYYWFLEEAEIIVLLYWDIRD